MPDAAHATADTAVFHQIRQRCDELRTAIQRVIVGQEQVTQALLAAVLCQGHTLIVGVPGLAKTLLVQTLGDCLGLAFKRIQFTPDMMPSDILGTELIQADPDSGQRVLRFMPGPIFAHLILADEINRTPPKTQAALLEAMAEQQVTVTGKTMGLDPPFIVVATQNPIEQEGTYPLPEAQLDRFMFSLWMDYPSKDDEMQIVSQAPHRQTPDIQPVFDRQALLDSSRVIPQMPVSQHVVDYAVSLIRATRPDEPGAPDPTRQYIAWGAGPRGGQYLVLGAKALAAIEGQPTPSCDHIRQVALPVLRHRVILNYAATGDGITPADLISQLIEAVPEPDYRA